MELFISQEVKHLSQSLILSFQNVKQLGEVEALSTVTIVGKSILQNQYLMNV